MKRLLICSRSHVPEGGADRIIVDLCRHLPRHGWDVRLALTQGARYNDVDHYLSVLGRDLPAIPVDGRLGTRTARIKALRATIRSARPDVVLSMRVFDTYEAVLLEKHALSGAPRLAVGIRSFEPPYLADLSMYSGSVDLCVTSGELLADLAVQACGLERDRVLSIGGGVHPPLQQVIPRKSSAMLSLLYAGRLDDGQKRIADLPPLLDALDRRGVTFCLHIAGSGPAEELLRERLAPRIANGQVVLHGWVTRENLYQYLYPQADIFLHLAGWEGMTIAPREAMAHGVVPVISRFRGLLREGQFVDGMNALTFPIGDPEAAADSVHRLQREPGLLARLSEAAAQSQQDRYSFDGAIAAWAEALERCVAQPGRSGALPAISDPNVGRLSRWGVSEAWQTRLRRWARRPVQHFSPGSEWPTASGRMNDQQRCEFEVHAKRIDESCIGAKCCSESKWLSSHG